MLFCHLWIFLKINFFSKNNKTFRNTIRVSNSLDPDQAQQNIGLIWVQTVYIGYQQTTKVATLAGKELMYISFVIMTTIHGGGGGGEGFLFLFSGWVHSWTFVFFGKTKSWWFYRKYLKCKFKVSNNMNRS